MRYFLFASHGRFAEGILHSVEMITGKHDNIWTLCAYIDEHNDIKSQIQEFLSEVADNDELVVITDIFGGSVNNEFMSLLDDKRIHLVTGLNIPLVIELITMNNIEVNTAKLIKTALYNSKKTIKYCNLELEISQLDEEF
ncbi:hypothetical protein ABD68_23535 [Bacillus endophyticus]|uniref:PTS sugar transporter subunit IIA n=1 Tax=Priestia endophytica TaxID=135735 RepID=UPI0018CE58CE|nr:PTS sugar transporter subunit IIA [Priestia endophytica]MBG9814423.1 hypothetical protein [Priestia endophytica]